MNEQLIQSQIADLRHQGVPAQAIAEYLNQVGRTMNPSMSRNDAVYISQHQPDAPGVYVSSEQQNVNTYNETLRLQELMYANERKNQVNAPERQEDVVAALAQVNPMYRVVTEGQNVTINDAGHIIRY